MSESSTNDGAGAPADGSVLGHSGSVFADNLRGDLKPIPDKEHTFAAYYSASSSDPGNTAKAVLFLHTGIALSDQLCEEWFEALGQAQVKNATARDFASNLGALTAVLLSVTGGSTAAVGAVAAGTNFAQKVLDSEMANYIIAPDIGIVRRAIIVERKAAVDEINEANIAFADALRALIAYDNLCSHNEVKRIVNESISQQTGKIAAQTTGVSEFYDTLLKTGIIGLKAILASTAQIDSDTVEALYGTEFKGNDITDAAATTFKTRLNKITDATGKIQYKAGHTEAELKAILTNVNVLGDLDKKLAADNFLKAPAGGTAGQPGNQPPAQPVAQPGQPPAPAAAPPPPGQGAPPAVQPTKPRVNVPTGVTITR